MMLFRFKHTERVLLLLPLLHISKCDVSQQITVVDGRYMLDIVVGERVEFIILSNKRIVRTFTCMIHTVTLDLAYVDLRFLQITFY